LPDLLLASSPASRCDASASSSFFLPPRWTRPTEGAGEEGGVVAVKVVEV
jgi:hypothetical protein